mgnify:CR=1 FL=1
METIEALQKALEEAQKALKPETASPAPKPTPAVTALRAPAGVKAVSTSTGDSCHFRVFARILYPEFINHRAVFLICRKNQLAISLSYQKRYIKDSGSGSF